MIEHSLLFSSLRKNRGRPTRLKEGAPEQMVKKATRKRPTGRLRIVFSQYLREVETEK